MTKLGHLLQEFLDLAGWTGDIETDEDTGVTSLSTGATVDSQQCRIYVSTADAQDSIAVFAYPPFRVRAAQYAEACKLVNAINYKRTPHGRLEIDPADGELRYRNSADVEFCAPTAAFVRSMVQLACGFLEYWMPALAEVAMTSRTAEEILAAMESPGQGAGEGQRAEQTEPVAARSTLLH